MAENTKLANTKQPKAARLGSSALILTASKFAAMAISFATGMMMARFRTLDENGTLSQLQTVVSLMVSLLTLGLPNTLNYFITRAESRAERRQFLSVYYTLSTLFGAVVGLVLVIGTPYIEAYYNNPDIRGFLYFLAVFPWASIVAGGIENLLVAYGRSWGMMWFRIAHSVCYLGIVLFVQFAGLTFRTFMLIYTVFESVFAIAVMVIANCLAGGLRISFNGAMIRKIFKYSIPIGLAAVMSKLDIEMDKLLIGRFFTTGELGIYSYVARELPVSDISSAVTAVLLPQFARMMKKKRENEAVQLWSHATFITLSLIALVSAGCFAFAPDVITLLYSEKYLPGVTVFRIYTLLILLRCAYFGIMLNTTGHTRFIMFSSIAGLGLNAVLNIAFYYMFGFSGPAIATLLSVVTINMVQLIFSSRILKIPFSKIFPWKQSGMILLINAGFALVFSLLKYLLPLERYLTSVWESVALGCVWGVIYILIMLRPIKRHWKELNSVKIELDD